MLNLRIYADYLFFGFHCTSYSLTAGSPLASPIYASISSPSTYFPPLLSDLASKPSTDGRLELMLAPGEKVKVPLLSLRLDECSLRGGALDVLGKLASQRRTSEGRTGANLSYYSPCHTAFCSSELITPWKQSWPTRSRCSCSDDTRLS